MFFDCVISAALAKMPEGCGVKRVYHANGELLEQSLGGEASTQIISALLYANDMVLMSCDRAELECMLQVMDATCNKMGMSSNTELMAYRPCISTGAAPWCDVVRWYCKVCECFQVPGWHGQHCL